MNGLLKKLSLAASVAAAALTLSATYAHAQGIYIVQGGRTTITLSDAFLADLTTAKITPTAIYDSQLYENKVFFPIASGEIDLANAAGQIQHSGGITLTAGTKNIRLDSFTLTTTGEESYITALAIANGKLVGRINLFDVELSSDLKFPLAPENGIFFISGDKLNLDPAGAAALNDAFGVKTFEDNLYVGYAGSAVFVPLAADGL
jgi:hypothetical protein